MTPEEWQRVRPILESALEMDAASRPSFLDGACEDPFLRREVESLINSHELAGTHELHPGSLHSLDPDEETRFRLPSGKRIGAYEILEEIAIGGMGAVYRAIRADGQYKQQVALKIVRSELGAEFTATRFKNERQILATLNHANIAKILDGGATADGLPYFVMELVEGQRLDEYCDAHKLATNDRLSLFLQVCSAVQYAHQHLVIHRDIKPGNILVTSEGVPKLLDFGIAKILGSGDTGHQPEQTLSLVRLLTPEYASPEQIRSQPVTPATDIYSLGVVLYELLTGHRPYRLTQHTPAEIERAICEQEPENPSAAVSRVEKDTSSDGRPITRTPELVSQAREGQPDKLRRRLRGDLDNIVLKALQKRPQRRYGSVKAFSEDIQRHLNHLPVEARRSTVAYRSSKFAKRHKTAVAAVATVILVALGGAVFARWEERRAAEKARAEVGGEHMPGRRSVAVLGFKNLSGRPETSWISTALSEMLTTELAAGAKLRTISGEDVARMKSDLSLPEADTLARETLSRVRRHLVSDYVVLGSYLDLGGNGGQRVRLDVRLQDAGVGETVTVASVDGVEADLTDLVVRAGAILRDKLRAGAVSPEEATSVKASQSSNPEALRLYAEGLARLRAFDALRARDLLERAVTADPSFALAHAALGEAWSKLGVDIKARDEAKRAFDLSSGLSREESLLVEARYRRAAEQWDRAIEIYRTLFNFFPDNLDYGLRLASALLSARKYNDALKAVESMRKLPSPERDDPRIDLYESYAAHALGDFKLSQTASARAADKARAGGAKLVVASALYHETWALLRLGELKQAAAAARQSKDIYDMADNEYGVSDALEATGAVLSDQGDVAGAIRAYQESLSIERKVGRKEGEAASLNNLAESFRKEGRLAEARKMFEQSLEIHRETGEKENAATTMTNIANLLDDEGNIAGAAEMYRRSLSLSREIGFKYGIVLALENLGDVLVEQGNLADAEKAYRESVELSRKTGDRHDTAYAFFGLGELFKMEGDLAKARQQHTQALTMREGMGEQVTMAESRMMLAQLSIEEGHAADIRGSLREGLEIFRQQKLREDELAAHVTLARALLSAGKGAEAQKEIDLGRELVAKSENRVAHVNFSIVAARIRAASRQPADFAEAAKALDAALAEARQYGLIGYQFEARLALDEMEMESGHVSAARGLLRALEMDASGKGFGLIARKAAAVRAGGKQR